MCFQPHPHRCPRCRPRKISLYMWKFSKRKRSAEKLFPQNHSSSSSWWCIISNLNFNYCTIIRRKHKTNDVYGFSFFLLLLFLSLLSVQWCNLHTNHDDTIQKGFQFSLPACLPAWWRKKRSSKPTNYIKIYSISSYCVCIAFSDFMLSHHQTHWKASVYVSPIQYPLSVCANNAIWANAHALWKKINVEGETSHFHIVGCMIFSRVLAFPAPRLLKIYTFLEDPFRFIYGAECVSGWSFLHFFMVSREWGRVFFMRNVLIVCIACDSILFFHRVFSCTRSRKLAHNDFRNENVLFPRYLNHETQPHISLSNARAFWSNIDSWVCIL